MLDAAKVEKVKQGLFRCFMKCNEPFAIGCGQCPYVGECYPSANEYESPETAALYTETVALIDELAQEIEQLRQHPDVVRCKECDFGNTCRNGKGELAVECRKPGGTHTELHEPGWFCADRWKGGGT